MTLTKSKILIAAMTAGLALSAAQASAHDQAQAERPCDNRPAFAEIDANGNGALTAEEITSFRQARRAEAMMERIDTDGNGVVSQAEFEAERERGPRMGRGMRGFARRGQNRGFDCDRGTQRQTCTDG